MTSPAALMPILYATPLHIPAYRWHFSALPFCWHGLHTSFLCLTRRLAAIILAAVSLIAGAVLSRWTMAEDRFLRKPDPEPPPSIFKR